MDATGKSKRLILMRHAKSEWVSDEYDVSRSLARRGVKDAVKMGKWFSGNLPPDRILCSSATRATETLDFLEIGAERDLRSITLVLDALYGCSFDSLIQIIEEHGSYGDLMIIGHNPSLEQFLLWCLEDSKMLSCYQKVFPTGAIYELEVSPNIGKVRRSSARLQNYMRPKLI